MKGLITHTVLKGNSFIYGISNPANRSVISQNIPSVPRCPTVPRPVSRDSGTGRDSTITNGKRKEADNEQLFVTEI